MHSVFTISRFLLVLRDALWQDLNTLYQAISALFLYQVILLIAEKPIPLIYLSAHNL